MEKSQYKDQWVFFFIRINDFIKLEGEILKKYRI